MGASVVDVIDGYFTCEFTTFARDGSPVAWPVVAHRLADGRFLLATSVGRPQKAFNIRRNPKVSLLFSDSTGSGLGAAAVLIQGDATAEDRIVSDMGSDPELAQFLEIVSARQPSSAFMSSAIGRRVFWSYYLRLLIYVTPRRVLFWPDRDFTSAPSEISPTELRRVG